MRLDWLALLKKFIQIRLPILHLECFQGNVDSCEIWPREEAVEEVRKVQEEAETPRDVYCCSEQPSGQNGHQTLEAKALLC